MALHSLPRSARVARLRKIARRIGLTVIGLSVLWCGLAICAAVANVRLTTVEAPVSAQVSQPAVGAVSEDDPTWNCATMGNHQCGDYAPGQTVYGYWTEVKPAAEGGNEDLYGDLRLAPAGSINVRPAASVIVTRS